MNGSRARRTEEFIESQRELLLKELDQREPPVPRTIPLTGACDPAVATRSRMDFVWNATPRNIDSSADRLAALASAQPVSAQSLEVDVQLHGEPIKLLPGLSFGAAGASDDGLALVGITGVLTESLATILIGIVMPIENYHPGTIEFHGYETYGLVAEVEGETQKLLGVIGEGSITFDEAGSQTGDVLRGTWQGKLAAMPADP